MAQVRRTEIDMQQYGGGRSLLGQNLKVYVLFPNAAVTIVQNGGLNDSMENSVNGEDGGEDETLQGYPNVNEGGENTI